MNSVSVQIQRAINDAISNQVLPQIQNVVLTGSGHVTRKGWNVPTERPEPNPEVKRNLNAKPIREMVRTKVTKMVIYLIIMFITW